MDIYLKLKKKAYLSSSNHINLGDIADIIATADVCDKLRTSKLMDIPNQRRASYLVSVGEAVKLVKKLYPDAGVSSLGEADTLVYYSAKPRADTPLVWLKVAAVAAVLFVGSATAIMSFHYDAEIPKVFSGMYEIIFGYEPGNLRLIQIPYSIGLAAGILIFFNHAFGKKLTDDPTPVEVQMSIYDNEVDDTIIDIIESRGDTTDASNT